MSTRKPEGGRRSWASLATMGSLLGTWVAIFGVLAAFGILGATASHAPGGSAPLVVAPALHGTHAGGIASHDGGASLRAGAHGAPGSTFLPPGVMHNCSMNGHFGSFQADKTAA